MMMMDGQGNYSCGVCGHTTQHQGNLKKHLEVHTNRQGINCAYCGKQFKTKNSYYSHVYRIHKGSSKIV